MPQEPEDTLDGAEPAAQFTAMVIEVRDSGTQAILLVEPMDGEDEKKVADRIEVATGKERKYRQGISCLLPTMGQYRKPIRRALPA